MAEMSASRPLRATALMSAMGRKQTLGTRKVRLFDGSDCVALLLVVTSMIGIPTAKCRTRP
jgi:hypothetical protein